jgi:hypothetical protein
MDTRAPRGQLIGRQRERKVLTNVLEAARGGHGEVLVVHGEPGVGKTALLEHVVDAAPDFRTARAVGVEGEMEFPFAALQRLCSPILEVKDRLPRPQRDALAVAFGLSGGEAPNPFLVGLAVLGLMSEAAEERPFLCVVDDAQWLDGPSARALAFVARRLLAEKIALLFAARGPSDAFSGLPELQVDGLSARDARTLLESVLPARLDAPILERLVIEARGNPLALLEMPRGLTPAQLAGGFGRSPRCLFHHRSRRALRGGWRICRAMPGGCCFWLPLTLWVMRNSFGVPLADSRSPSRPRTPLSRKACWRSAPRSRSAIPSFDLLCIARPHPMSGARSTERWPRRPIRRSTQIAAPGTVRRRRPYRMRRSLRGSNVPQHGRRHEEGWRLRQRS